jgi:riboflavin kinase/FMN adenylyltransferase
VRIFDGCGALAKARDGGAEPTLARPLAVAIGNFDGVHRGHQALIQAARARAAARPGPPPGAAAVLTFTPHPARVFAPALAPPLIMSLERRLGLLAEAGVEIAVVEPFTRELASVEAEDFVRDVLADKLGARDVVVGYDFSFGRGRRGDPAMLARIGSERGLAVTVVPPVMADGLVCSSTKIREFALEGRVEGAALLLGRPFEVEGLVVRGAGRGRKLGVPTANVAVEGELLPRLGIYAGRARILEGSSERAGAAHRAAISVGSNPTFVAGGGVSVEAYLLDFDGDLYGQRLRVELTARLRDEQRFESVEALVEQIDADIARVRTLVP